MKKLEVHTVEHCLPEGKLKGVITFGSPISVFFSSIYKRESLDSSLTKKVVEYFRIHDLFWLHINHRCDPLGASLIEIGNLFKGIDGKGFVVNNDLKSTPGQLGTLFRPTIDIHDWSWNLKKSFLKSARKVYDTHGWYWNKPKDFSKLIQQTYESGYHTCTEE